MEFQKLYLDCGARLYVCEMPHVNSVSSGILVHAGTRDEILFPGKDGLAHINEHAVFLGNEEFPTSEKMARYIEKLGGICQGETSKETTLFWNKALAEDFAPSATHLYHLVTTPTYPAELLEVELQDVVQEIKGYNDIPEDLAGRLFEKTAYENHPLAKEILGTEDTVSLLTRDDLLRWHETFCYPANFDFIVAGNIKTEAAFREFNEIFIEREARGPHLRLPSEPVLNKRRTVILERNVSQVHLCMGATTGGSCARESRALRIFKFMIGDGMSAPLFQGTRGIQGLCYLAQINLEPHSDYGKFYVYAATDPKQFRETRSVVLECLTEYTRDKDLFAGAKKTLKRKIEMGVESSEDTLQMAVGKIAYYGDVKRQDTYLQEIESIELEEVTEAVERCLNPETLTETYLIPEGFDIAK